MDCLFGNFHVPPNIPQPQQMDYTRQKKGNPAEKVQQLLKDYMPSILPGHADSLVPYSPVKHHEHEDTSDQCISHTPPKRNFDPDVTQEVLSAFDLDQRFGPCVGLTRQCRWDRAQKLRLYPSLDIAELLQQFPNESSIQKTLLDTDLADVVLRRRMISR